MLVFSSIGSLILFKEKISRIRAIGIVTILSGVISIGIVGFDSFSTQVIVGDLMFIGCGALWASFTLLCKYWQLSPWSATSMVSVISGVICLPFAIKTVENIPVNLLILHGAYQGILVAIIALYSYSKSVAMLGAVKGAIFASLVPPVSLILSFVILNEKMTINEMIGSGLIFLGMSLALGTIKLTRHQINAPTN